MGTCNLEGIKGSPTKPSKVRLNFDTFALRCWILLPKVQISVAVLGFLLNTYLNLIGWTQSQKSWHLMQDYPKYLPCVILPKVAKQPQKQISYLWSNPRIIKFAILPPDQSYVFGLLLINPLSFTIKGNCHQLMEENKSYHKIPHPSCYFQSISQSLSSKTRL